uniref:Ferric-chelate reductase 1a n=1 Tax=Electrophorus electricus TaxID=8005 RepID=A0A4W4FJA4_ELEEL
MIPLHSHHSSSEPSPYNISVDKVKFSPGGQIKVTLSTGSSDSKLYFSGFLIQARDFGHPSAGAVGSFALLEPAVSQLLQCNNIEGSAVSHTSSTHKTEVQVLWTAPQNSPSKIRFQVTVVQKYNLYWARILGPVVSLNDTSPLPPQSTAGFSSEGCGFKKSCLRDPVGCDPHSSPHCYFLSFWTEDQSVVFELSGLASGYVSFALSTDKWMGHDDVYLCINYTDHVDISAAYVVERTHPVTSSENVLRDMAWRLSDGVIQCSFRRNIRIPGRSQNRFDLDQTYYLFMAHGRVDNGRTHRHDRQPLISESQVVITGPPEDLGGSRSPLLIKFHGVFMLIAWMTTVSTGVIMARYFKPDWPETTVCGHRVWFQFHRALMILTVLLTCTGFILPFIYRRGWSKRAGSHPYLGCTVMLLAVIQPIVALFRPAADSSRRYIFNWVHLGTGTVAQVIAVVAIFLGIHQQALLLPAPWTTGLLAGHVVWFVLADIVLEVHRRGLFPTVIYLCGNFVCLTLLLGTISRI